MRSEEHYPQMPQSPYTNSSFYEDGLNHGLNKAWDFARYLLFISPNSEVLREIYGEESAIKIINSFEVKKAIEKYEKWKENQNIKAGDVLIHRNDKNIKMIVTSINDNRVSGFSNKGIFLTREVSSWKTTGLNVQDELNKLYEEINDLTKE